jgi:purine-nucleoside phosphorylase
MCEPYDQQWVDRTIEIGRQHGLGLHKGVFVAVSGPNLETRAEYRFLRTIGADVVGMSTVPETIVAVQCGLKTVGLSVITDMCLADALKPANVAEIIATANEAAPKLVAVVKGIVGEVGQTRVA